MAWEWTGFEDWFEAQCGKEPSPGISLADLMQAEEDAAKAARKASNAVREREDWLIKRESALYGWSAQRSRIEDNGGARA